MHRKRELILKEASLITCFTPASALSVVLCSFRKNQLTVSLLVPESKTETNKLRGIRKATKKGPLDGSDPVAPDIAIPRSGSDAGHPAAL